MSNPREAFTPQQTVDTLLRIAGTNLILVGGQSLSVWVRYYNVELPDTIPAITLDVDFLTRDAADKKSVSKLARALGGSARYPNIRSLTALVGQAIREISKDEYLNVDVIWDVLGVKKEAIWDHAVKFDVNDSTYLVMHPMHVLMSRATNLHKVQDKQNIKGTTQLELSISVMREFLRSEAKLRAADPKQCEQYIQRYVSAIERLSLSDAGRKIAIRYNIHIADAIDPNLISSRAFWDNKWPAIKTLMSPSCAAQFSPPSAPGSAATPPLKRSGFRPS